MGFVLPGVLHRLVLGLSSLRHPLFLVCWWVFSKPPHSAPNAHQPAKIRTTPSWEGKALLIPEYCAWPQGCTFGNQCECFAQTKSALLYIYIYKKSFSNLFLPSSLATKLFPTCFSPHSSPMLLLDLMGSLEQAPAMSHRSPHLAHELFTPFAGCLV